MRYTVVKLEVLLELEELKTFASIYTYFQQLLKREDTVKAPL